MLNGYVSLIGVYPSPPLLLLLLLLLCDVVVSDWSRRGVMASLFNKIYGLAVNTKHKGDVFSDLSTLGPGFIK